MHNKPFNVPKCVRMISQSYVMCIMGDLLLSAPLEHDNGNIASSICGTRLAPRRRSQPSPTFTTIAWRHHLSNIVAQYSPTMHLRSYKQSKLIVSKLLIERFK